MKFPTLIFLSVFISTMILGLIIINFNPRNLGYVVGDGLFLGFIVWIPSQLIYNRIKKQR